MTTSVMDPRSDTGRIVVMANGLLSSFGRPSVRKFTRRSDNGKDAVVYAYSAVPVFRSGTFSDSMGTEREWLPEQVDQMAANFSMLRSGGYFTDVPVRKGHPGIFSDSMDGLIGYITDLRTETRKSPLADDDNEYRYLVADYEILDEDAQRKIESSLWRNRSAEIGMYATNSPVKEIWPTFMGVAYVDIPAVEGLNGFARNFGAQHTDMSIQLEELDMPTNTIPKVTDGGSTPAPANGPSQFRIGGVDTNDHARVQEYITGLERQIETDKTAKAEFARQVADLAAFKTAAVASLRETRITDLAKVKDGRQPIVTAAELEGIRAFAALLDDEKFDAYMKTMETRQPNPLFGVVPTGGNPAAGAPATEDKVKAAREAQFATDVDIVLALREHANMTDAQLQASESFQRIKAAGFTGSPATLQKSSTIPQK
jgi:hypothetical protein